MYHNTYPYASKFFPDYHQQKKRTSWHYYQNDFSLPTVMITIQIAVRLIKPHDKPSAHAAWNKTPLYRLETLLFLQVKKP
jgi:hypothetical protein